MAQELAALRRNPRAVLLLMPELTALLKPVRRDRPAEWEQLAHSPADADAWYVHLLVGDLALARRLAACLPLLPWFCFQRGLRSPQPHLIPTPRLLH